MCMTREMFALLMPSGQDGGCLSGCAGSESSACMLQPLALACTAAQRDSSSTGMQAQSIAGATYRAAVSASANSVCRYVLSTV